MSKSMHVELIDYCKNKNIIFLSTPYDEDSVDLLDSLNVPAFKIASTDTSNLPLLSYVAKKGRPMILSSAMATMSEVENAVSTIREAGLNEIAMLQCTGNYPSKVSDSNLRVIKTYKEKLKCIIGYSDHTPDMLNPVAATSIGAKIYEKHFTINRSLPGPDHRMSLDPEELKKTIQLIRDTELSLGNSTKKVLESEKENRLKLRKSIVSSQNIKKDEIISSKMVSIKRPGNGIQPKDLNLVIGKKTLTDIPEGTVLLKEMIDENKR
jgi:N,N'-diacetyllegionaminate synthase